MKINRYRRIVTVVIGFMLIAQVLFLAPKVAALSNSGETVKQAGAESKRLPAGVNPEDWEQITRQIDPYYGQQAYLKAASPDAGDHFGYSVDISGDTLVVGAYYADTVGTNPIVEDAGSAFVFVRSGTAWVQQAQLFASNPDQYDQFG